MKKISELLLQWYASNQRDLPWRRRKSAYEIWVSEIMLQQTRVETVISYYERFLAELPDLSALAEVSEERLLKLWEGLGYYSRVRNMQKAARVCMEQYGGQLPKTAAELEKLPGIGHYTAGAIASIAYGEQVCAVDGNLGRIYARLFLLEDDMTTPAGRKKVEKLIRQDMAEDMGSMNQALMDIGADAAGNQGPVAPADLIEPNLELGGVAGKADDFVKGGELFRCGCVGLKH